MPLAFVDKDMPVVVVAPNNDMIDIVKNQTYRSARGGQLFVFADHHVSIHVKMVLRSWDSKCG